MYKYNTVSGYKITSDPNFQNEYENVPSEVAQQSESLFLKAIDPKNEDIIKELTDLIIAYPQVPYLKNHLSSAYAIRGNRAKAFEINNLTIKEHPDYLFAKLNLASFYLENKETDKVPLVLGDAMDLKLLYPQRDLFHIAEVIAFYKIVTKYFIAIGNLEMAKKNLEILESIAPYDADTTALKFACLRLVMTRTIDRLDPEKKQKITSLLNMELLTNIKTPPHFNHPEIEELYRNGLRIPHELLRQIIALPRNTLIADLEKVLIDVVERYDMFKDHDLQENEEAVVIHTLLLLKEIQSDQSLQHVLTFLESSEDILDFWLGEHLTETVWQCLYGLGLNHTLLLKEFLLKPGIYTYAKCAVSETLAQMVFHEPDKKAEISELFYEVYSTFAGCNLNDNLIDSEFLGLSIIDIIDCKLTELMPVIKTLIEKNYVSPEIISDFAEVEQHFKDNNKFERKRKLYSITDLYSNILTTWQYYKGNTTPKKPVKNDFKISQPPVSSLVKTGRNEPCICGSGKKYKKCCGA